MTYQRSNKSSNIKGSWREAECYLLILSRLTKASILYQKEAKNKSNQVAVIAQVAMGMGLIGGRDIKRRHIQIGN
jgi:hypothetical protein